MRCDHVGEQQVAVIPLKNIFCFMTVSPSCVSQRRLFVRTGIGAVLGPT